MFQVIASLFTDIKSSVLPLITCKEENKMRMLLDQNKVLDLKEKTVFEDKYQYRKA